MLSHSCTLVWIILHIKHVATFEVPPPPLHVFLLTLPNGLMDWGCIGGTHVCRDSPVIIDSLREDVWNASHCKLRSLLCSPARFIKEAVRHSKTPPPLCNQTPMPSHKLIALIVIIYKILRICVLLCGTWLQLHLKHRGWLKQQQQQKPTVAKQ